MLAAGVMESATAAARAGLDPSCWEEKKNLQALTACFGLREDCVWMEGLGVGAAGWSRLRSLSRGPW